MQVSNKELDAALSQSVESALTSTLDSAFNNFLNQQIEKVQRMKYRPRLCRIGVFRKK